MLFNVSPKAYGKLVFHCCKYPHAAVNGVLIGAVSKKDNNVVIQDAVPLFHHDLSLAPMLAVAVAQVEVYAETKGLCIVGYYHANELIDDHSINDTAATISNKIASNTEKSCLLLVDNNKLSADVISSEIALKMYTKFESSSQWKEHKDILIEGGSRTLKAIGRQVYNKAYEDLVDFDNHLDCVELDWTNPEINRALADIDTSTTVE